MNQEMPKQESPEEYQKRVVSEEAREAFEKVEAGKEAESVIEEKKESTIEATTNRIDEIVVDIRKAFEGDPFMIQSEEKASEFLKSTYAKIAEGSMLVNRLKDMDAPKTNIKRFENTFNTFREKMAEGEDILADRIFKDAA